MRTITLATLLAMTLATAAESATAQPMEVLHWWTSEGERAAASILRDSVTAQGVEWQDQAIHGGAGESAMAVLKAQIIAGELPDVAQIIGPNIQHWSDLGYLEPLDAWDDTWPGTYYPTIDALTMANGVRSAVPVSIHRINWLWLNAAVYREHNLTPPTTWSQVFQDAEVLKAAGVIPLAHGGQPWQTATLFETLLLSVAGPAFYRDYFVDMDPTALQDPRVAEALTLLRQLKGIMDDNIHNRQWQEAIQMVHTGEAAMQVMGDWAKAELQAMGGTVGEDFLCMPVPGTAQNHLYSIDTLVFFVQPDATEADAQAAFGKGILDADAQLSFSARKGTIPVRSDLPLDQLDDCAQTSAHVFREAESAGLLAPSVAHSMATSPIIEGAIFDALHRFFRDDTLSAATTQQQLARLMGVLRDHE